MNGQLAPFYLTFRNASPDGRILSFPSLESAFSVIRRAVVGVARAPQVASACVPLAG